MRIEDSLQLAAGSFNPVIGYDKAAEIAKKAYKEGRPVKEVAAEMTDLSKKDLDRLLDPGKLSESGNAGE